MCNEPHGGVADRRGEQNTVFATLESLTKRFQTQ